MSTKSENQLTFENEVMSNLDSMYRYALHLARNQEDATDLVQETCARSLKAADKFKHGTNARAWLFAIMRNIFFNQHRAKSRGEIPSDWTDEVESGDQRFTGSVWPQPFEMFLRDMMREDIDKAMAGLSIDFRSVVLLCDVEGFSYAETAEILEIPVGTVRSRLHRARASMQKMLSQWFNEGLGANES
ncbi:MAG: sigma-70 family RNA polymerase sigma factor [Candidatus Sabulitectum sp.]|nr:sigma-70 family RNA polymerase sigma factor [Candidatus Sabulitectum sp.]